MRENAVQHRTFDFAPQVIALYTQLRHDHEYVLSKQLLRSGTSIGANVEEALAGQSRSDFISKMSIARKEARETKYWLRLLQGSQLTDVDVSEYVAQVVEAVNLDHQDSPRTA